MTPDQNAEKIMAKIKKCLALSASSNPGEAAAAMRQAKALMAKLNVNEADVEMSEIAENSAPLKTMAHGKVALWESALASVVGDAFSCISFVKYGRNSKGKAVSSGACFVFAGRKSDSQIAAYTFDVLSRKCVSMRRKWMKENLPSTRPEEGICGISKAAATNAGNAFAQGWVKQIQDKVEAFANPDKAAQNLARNYFDKKYGSKTSDLANSKVSKGGSLAINAYLKGMDAAKNESLYRPCGTDRGPLQIEG